MKLILTKTVLAFGLLDFAAQAHATTTVTTANTTVNIYNGPSSSGLDVNLTIKADGSNAEFIFSNTSTGGAINSAIHEIYFEKGLGTLLNIPYLYNYSPDTSTGVSLTDVKPLAPAIPTSGGLSPAWSGNLFNVSYDDHQNKNAVHVGQSWAILFTLVTPGTTADAILNAILDQSGLSRIILHIGDCVTGSSCWTTLKRDTTITNVSTVPLPPAKVLFGSGLAGLTLLARRKKGVAKAI